MLKLKYLLSLLLIFSITYTASSQYFFKLSSVKFTEDLGIIYNPAIGLEVEKISPFSDRSEKLQLRYSVGAFTSSAKMESFPAYDIGATQFIGGTPQDKVVPSEARYGRLYVFPLEMNLDYRFLKGDFSPFLKAGIVSNIMTYAFRKVGGLRPTMDTVTTVSIGSSLSAGLNYQLNDDLQILISLGKTSAFSGNSSAINYWKSMIGFSYFW